MPYAHEHEPVKAIAEAIDALRPDMLTDEMFRAAAHAVAESVTDTTLSRGGLFPGLERIREVSLAT